jgi:hypothetical protein
MKTRALGFAPQGLRDALRSVRIASLGLLVWSLAPLSAAQAQSPVDMKIELEKLKSQITELSTERGKKEADRDRAAVDAADYTRRGPRFTHLAVKANALKAVAETEMARLDAELTPLNEQKDILEKKLSIQAHMNCVAISRGMFRFLEHTKFRGSISRESVVNQVQGDLRTEYARVTLNGIEADRQNALMSRLLVERARDFFSTVRATATPDLSFRYSPNASQILADAERDYTTRLQAIQNQPGKHDCEELKNSLATAERVYWAIQSAHDPNPGETIVGSQFSWR